MHTVITKRSPVCWKYRLQSSTAVHIVALMSIVGMGLLKGGYTSAGHQKAAHARHSCCVPLMREEFSMNSVTFLALLSAHSVCMEELVESWALGSWKQSALISWRCVWRVFTQLVSSPSSLAMPVEVSLALVPTWMQSAVCVMSKDSASLFLSILY